MISTSTVETLQIYCQNIGPKHIWTINLLEQMEFRFDILFLQEPPWATVRYTASLTEKDGVPVKGPPIHPDWIYLYEVFTLPHLFRSDSNWIARTPRTVLGQVLAERPAKCPFGVRASPSGIHRTTQSLWTVHGLGPSGVQVEPELPVSWSSSDCLLLYFKKYLCQELNPQPHQLMTNK
jgi:hypothetical protein